MPVWLGDMIRAYVFWSLVYSPVLRLQAALALAVCLAVVLFVALAGSLASAYVRAGAGQDARNIPRGGVEMAAVSLASGLILFTPAFKGGMWGIVLLVFAGTAFAAAAVLIMARLLPAKFQRHGWWVISTFGLTLWIYGLFAHLAGDIGEYGFAAPACGALGVALLIPVVALPKLEGSVRKAAAAAACLVGLGAPLGMYAAVDEAAGVTGIRDGSAAGREVNVLVFMVETLRADHMGPWGYGPKTTPFVEELLTERKSTLFSRAWPSAPYTYPSVKSFFTGQPASHWGYYGAEIDPPPLGTWTMAEAFRRSGYRTAAFLAQSIRKEGFRQGFEEYRVMNGFSSLRKSLLLYKLLFSEAYWRALKAADRWRLHEIGGKSLLKMARGFFDRRDDRPFFMYLHLFEPHWPYYSREFGLIPARVRNPPAPLFPADLLQLPVGDPSNSRFLSSPGLAELVGRYDEEIRLSDDLFREMTSLLEEAGLSDSTLIIFVSDHGEEFFEHNGFSHGHDVYEEQARVPLIFFYPDHKDFAGMPENVETPLSLMDVLPTLTDYLRLEPAPEPLTGRSLRPLLEGGRQGPPVIIESFPYEGSYCNAGYREGPLVVRMTISPELSPVKSTYVSVFDLDADPRQISPLAADDPRAGPITARARKAMYERWLGWQKKATRERIGARGGRAMERMRSLGYLQ